MSARIEVTPQTALIDVERAIVLTGFAPRAEVEMIARQRQADGSEWESANCFMTDDAGAVDLRTAVPVSGDYQGNGAQPMGVIWSMRCVKETPGVDSIQPIVTAIEARDAHGAHAVASRGSRAGRRRHAVHSCVPWPTSGRYRAQRLGRRH
jgi:hypothetical protein